MAAKKKRIGPCKVVTLGRIAVMFYDDRNMAYAWMDGWPEKWSIIYEGNTPIPRKVCDPIALLHPKFIKYNEIAMAALYQGCGKLPGLDQSLSALLEDLQSGTEDPALAVNSFALKPGRQKVGHESFKKALIWDPFKQEEGPN